jgi:hypothetical protein
MTAMVQVLFAITKAEAALAADPIGSLPLQSRRGLWLAFGPVEKAGNRVLLSKGTLLRSRLAAIAAQLVQQIWLARWPNDRRPLEMLRLLEEYLAGRLEAQSAEHASEAFRNFMDDLDDEYSIHDTDVIAGAAAMFALQTPLYEAALSETYAKCKSDLDLDPWGWDAGLAASIAASGGGPWDRKGSVQKRREFWTQYLQGARQVSDAEGESRAR